VLNINHGSIALLLGSGLRLIKKNRILLQMDWDVKIYNASHETDRGTNALTTMRCEGDFSLMCYERILA